MTPMPPAWAMAMAMRRLGHRVHGGGHQRDAELDRAREPGAGVGLAGQHLGGGRLQQDVVERQSFLKLHANLQKEKQNGGPFGGRRVGEPLYTLPRTNQANWRAGLCTEPQRPPRKSRFPISTPHWRKIA